MYGEINIYTLNRATTKTTIWQGYSYEAMRHITGKQERPLTCYVEDDGAEEIIGRVAGELRLRRFLSLGRYGPAGNAFSLGAGLCLSLNSTENTLVVLDGDVYGNQSERKKHVNSAMTGNQPEHDQQRKTLMRLVRALAPFSDESGKPLSPEQVLHRMLHSLDRESVSEAWREILDIAISIENVPEKHGFVDHIIEHTGESRQVALSKIVELASLSARWPKYTRVVRKWFKSRKATLVLAAP
jgi:hypothetical protein